MYALKPTAAQFLFHRSARKVQPDLVEKGTTPVGPRDPNHHGRCVGHVSKALFTFAQLAKRMFSFCYVFDSSDIAGNFAQGRIDWAS